MSDIKDVIKWFLEHPIITASGLLFAVLTIWVASVNENVIPVNTKLTMLMVLFVGVLVWWFGTENILSREIEK
jgi:hypothetical protein